MSTVSDAKPTTPAPRRGRAHLLSVVEVAEYLAIPWATLYQWCRKGCGPAAYRLGRHLRYGPAARTYGSRTVLGIRGARRTESTRAARHVPHLPCRDLLRDRTESATSSR